MTFKPRPDKWDDESLRKLFRLYKEGKSMEEIYAAFPERKPKNIQNKMHKQGLVTRGYYSF